MIAVVAKPSQKPAVEEFFELFKTPWHYFEQGSFHYDIVIATHGQPEVNSARLLIIFGNQEIPLDKEAGVEVRHSPQPSKLQYGLHELPIYRGLTLFGGKIGNLLGPNPDGAAFGYSLDRDGQRILRLGYDLFDEVEFLLSHGQPPENAHVPTLDLHIAMLRQWIVQAGVPLVEIPPRPFNYDFITCLTHDVDFLGIREHKLDRSVMGFALRVAFPLWVRDIHGRLSWSRILRNWKALVSLPAVHAGVCNDFWFDLDRYLDLEKGRPSTFFFIPFKGEAGLPMDGGDPCGRRAAKYDIEKYRAWIQTLIEKGHEVGLHGLDAWKSQERGAKELDIIRQVTGQDQVGVRMHWLYFDEKTPQLLQQTGFLYDSSRGYNDALGFHGGTTQIFRLPGTDRLYELPLTIMDTSLFYPDRMGLSEADALQHVDLIIDAVKANGGVLTINWHTRSLSPERNWDSFYNVLLRKLESERVWFASARDAVRWFETRRSLRFGNISLGMNSLKVKLRGKMEKAYPSLALRAYFPCERGLGFERPFAYRPYIDVPWSGESELELPM